jgi:hypothetical protein
VAQRERRQERLFDKLDAKMNSLKSCTERRGFGRRCTRDANRGD